MPNWKDAAPGIERAKCVLAPRLNAPEGFHIDYVKAAHSQDTGAMAFAGNAATRRGLVLFDYFDGDNSRVISAARVESAVEVAEFLAMCADEGLCAQQLSCGDWHIWLGSNYDAGHGDAQSIRGAYLAYHASRNRAE